jgi:hypothetical protein
VSTATKTAAGNGRIDVDGYRERVADAVGIAGGELSAQGRDDPQLVMSRMVAGYFLCARDRLLVVDIARIMNRNESNVRYAIDYVERRMDRYYAFKVYVEQTMATYALASK